VQDVREAAATVAGGGRRPRVFYGYWLVLAAFLAQFVALGAQNYITGPFLPAMTEEFDWSHSEFTLARTLGQFVMAFTGLVIGTQVDRHGGRWLMRIGIAVLGTAMFLLGSVQELWHWWLLNGLMLTAGSAMIGNLVVNVTLAKWFVERRGRMIGIGSMGVSAAGILLTPFTALLVEEIGWRAAWRVLALLAIAIIVPLSFLMRRQPEDHGLHPDGKSDSEVARGEGLAAASDFASSLTRRQAMRTPAFYLVALAFGLGVLNVQVVLIQTIAYLTSAGYQPGFAALMITVTSVPATLLKPVWGTVIDRSDAQRASLAGFFFTATGLVLIVVGVQWGVTPLLVLAFFLLGIGWSGFIPMQEVIWATFFGRRYLGTVRSAGLPIVMALGASAPLLTALYFDRVGSYDGAFFAVGVLTFIGGLIMLVVRRPARA
jgi:MFS transporter, OFA family, oxalate/formate antiporter